LPLKIRLLCLIAGAALTTGVAFADTSNELPTVLRVPQATGAACASLQRQFDQEIAAHASAPKAASARVLRQSGEQNCNRGNYAGGVKDLAKALRNINVQPTMQ
jgi:hypothetical protein